jgi:xanthine/uracil permease
MVRFTGMAAGYAWVAVTYPLGNLWVTFGGAALAAVMGFIPTVLTYKSSVPEPV